MSTRQQALATAQVYVKRFYTKVELRYTNPYLVLTTAFYLACKMEECPQHIRFVVNDAKLLWPGIPYCFSFFCPLVLGAFCSHVHFRFHHLRRFETG
jgi:hypothetical protein